MNSICDKEYNTYYIDLNLDTAKRIRAECGVDLIDTDPELPTLKRLMHDRECLLNVIASLCSAQLEMEGISKETFKSLFDDISLQRTLVSIFNEIIYFFPPPGTQPPIPPFPTEPHEISTDQTQPGNSDSTDQNQSGDSDSIDQTQSGDSDSTDQTQPGDSDSTDQTQSGNTPFDSSPPDNNHDTPFDSSHTKHPPRNLSDSHKPPRKYHDPYNLALQYAGVLSVNPGPFTLRDLESMYRAKAYFQWNMTASLMALIINLNTHGNHKISPDELNPFAPRPSPFPKLSPANSMDILRSIFTNTSPPTQNAKKT